VVGDDDCVIVVPQGIAGEVADEVTEMTAYEDFVVEKVRAGTPVIGLYPNIQDRFTEEFAAWRKRENR
jgi:regulator of RNase E activity RraA